MKYKLEVSIVQGHCLSCICSHSTSQASQEPAAFSWTSTLWVEAGAELGMLSPALELPGFGKAPAECLGDLNVMNPVLLLFTPLGRIFMHTHTFTGRLVQSCSQLKAAAMAEEFCQGAGTASRAGDAHSTVPAHCNPPRDLHEAKTEMLGSFPSSMPLLCLFQAFS